MRTVPENAVFVVFEGLDGTGKTSCAKQTAELLGARYMTTPSLALRQYRDEIIASFNGSQEAAHLFYLATVLAASDEVKSCLAKGQSVVLDRYLLSTQVYAKFRGSVLDADESVGKLLLPADWTVFLDASLSVRQSRALERGCSVADGETMTKHANARLLQGYEQRIHHPVVGQRMRIETSAMSVQEISQQVVTKILRIESDVAKARPIAKGHYQPVVMGHLPSEIDLTKMRFDSINDFSNMLDHRLTMVYDKSSDQSALQASLDSVLSANKVQDLRRLNFDDLCNDAFINAVATLMELPPDLLKIRAKEAALKSRIFSCEMELKQLHQS